MLQEILNMKANQKTFGNRNEWAIDITPLKGGEKLSCDPNEEATWSAIRLWAGGHNLTAHKDQNGQFHDAIHWPAIHLARWFVQAWPAFCGLIEPPIIRSNPKELCKALDLACTEEQVEDNFLEARDAFISKYCLTAAGAGGLLPEVYFSSTWDLHEGAFPTLPDRDPEVIRIYWDNVNATFQSAFGDVIVTAPSFLKVIRDFVHHIEAQVQKADSNPIELMNVHSLRTWPTFFEEVWQGRKTFEIRWNDRKFQVGDILMLREWSKEKGYSGRKLPVKVTYIPDLQNLGCLAEGYVCMSIAKISTGFEINTVGTVFQ